MNSLIGGTPTEREQQYRNLYESNLDGIVFTDMEGHIVHSNRAFREMLGYSAEELATLNYQQLTPQKWHDMESRIVTDQIAGRGYSGEYEKEYVRKDGTIFPISIRVWLVKDNMGTVSGMWGIVRDITERRRITEALWRSERRYRTFVEVTSQFAWVTDAHGQVVDDIPSWRSFTGQTYEEVKGSGWSSVLHPQDLQRTLEVWNRSISSKTPYELEYRARRRDGVYRLLLAKGVPVLDEQGNVVEWVGTCVDITERKLAEKERERLLEELQNAMATVKKLSGLLPICAYCKKIRDRSGNWEQIEAYIKNHSEANFSHGVCPDCYKKQMDDLGREI